MALAINFQHEPCVEMLKRAGIDEAAAKAYLGSGFTVSKIRRKVGTDGAALVTKKTRPLVVAKPAIGGEKAGEKAGTPRSKPREKSPRLLALASTFSKQTPSPSEEGCGRAKSRALSAFEASQLPGRSSPRRGGKGPGSKMMWYPPGKKGAWHELGEEDGAAD
jgi:hypothetical protein